MNEEFAVLLFFFGISVTVNVGLLFGAFRSARRLRRFENHLLTPAAQDQSRVERLEQAVETMDARIDQLVRGQDFLGKLVSEGRHAIVKRERHVTPV